MMKRLFFICPTDFLETIINDTFKGENYFVTSLGNSISFEAGQAEEINVLIDSKGIQEIIFVLSEDNRIHQNAQELQGASNINGLYSFCSQIEAEKVRSALRWKSDGRSKAVLYKHLKKKVQDLKSTLHRRQLNEVKLKTLVYSKRKEAYSELQHDLLDFKFSLN